MKKSLSLFAAAGFMALTGVLGAPASAQPSDAQIKKQLTKPGVLSVKLVGRGTKEWSSVHMQYFWERGAVIMRTANIPEYPNAKLEIGGFARYTIVGLSYRYREFKVSSNKYSGIPTPTESQVMPLLNKDLPKFLGYHYSKIVGDLTPIKLAADPQWSWHTPNSVSFLATTTFEEIADYTHTEKKKAEFEVRLYRDGVKAPWKNFISSPKSQTSLGKTTHDADEIRALKTLAILDAEKQAAGQAGSLPAINVPVFKTDFEVFQYTHNVLREGNAAKIEAYLRKMLSPDFFVKGSTVLLTAQGDELIETIKTRAANPKIKYAQQYAADPHVKHYQTGMIEFWNAQEPIFARMAVGAFGGTWQNGVKSGQELKLTDLSIGVVSKPDDIARLKSLSLDSLQAAASRGKTFSQQFASTKIEQQGEVVIQAAQRLQWTPHTEARARLKVAFPAEPKLSEGTMNDKYPMWTLEATNAPAMCRAVSIIYPIKLNRMQSQAVVNSTIEILAKNNNAKIAQQSEYSGNRYGKAFTLDVDDTLIKGRVFVIGDVLYQLIMSSSKTAWPGLEEKAFFDSFEALE